MGAPAESSSLISYLPATSYCLGLRSVHFSYLSGLECAFGKHDPPRQRAPITFRTAGLFARRQDSPLGRRFPAGQATSRNFAQRLNRCRYVRKYVAKTTDVHVIEPLPGKSVLSLQTCTLPNYVDGVIVRAELVDEALTSAGLPQ